MARSTQPDSGMNPQAAHKTITDLFIPPTLSLSGSRRNGHSLPTQDSRGVNRAKKPVRELDFPPGVLLLASC
jgi:hypothetical protein